MAPELKQYGALDKPGAVGAQQHNAGMLKTPDILVATGGRVAWQFRFTRAHTRG